MEMLTKCTKVASNWQTTKHDRRGGWKIICHVKAHKKKTFAEIINYVNDILTRQLSSHTVRRYNVVFVPVVL